MKKIRQILTLPWQNVVMGDEFQQLEAKRQAGLREQHNADFTAELNGNENGRIGRFGLRDKSRQEQIRKERDKQTLSQALKISAAYAELYNSTFQLLHDTRDAVYEAQLLASAQLEQAQRLYQEALDNAATLPDGTAVFMDEDGSVYTQDGVRLEGDVLDTIFWPENPTARADFLERQSEIEAKHERFDRINGLDIRLDEIQARIEDKNNPPSMEEMKAYKVEIKGIKSEAVQMNQSDMHFNDALPKPQNDAPLNLKGFEI